MVKVSIPVKKSLEGLLHTKGKLENVNSSAVGTGLKHTCGQSHWLSSVEHRAGQRALLLQTKHADLKGKGFLRCPGNNSEGNRIVRVRQAEELDFFYFSGNEITVTLHRGKRALGSP